MAKIYTLHTTAGPQCISTHRDGRDHINVYSGAHTELGRALSNFARTPFVSEQFGEFQSLEGAWRWLSTGKKYEILRTKFGVDARNFRRSERTHYEDFHKDIIHVTQCKLKDNPHILEMLMDSHLPLAHYYAFGNSIVDATKGNMFQLKEFDLIRIRGLP